jgi:hypothetical protein
MTWPKLVLAAAGAVLVYALGLAIYRLTFHPLAKFPGPKLAGMTYWYECYYDVIKWGQYTNRIQAMHERYGQSPLSLSSTFLTIMECVLRPHCTDRP